MHLGAPTINKFVRESLVTTEPLTPNEADIRELKKRLTVWFAQAEDLKMDWQDRSQTYGPHAHLLCTVSILNPRYHYSSASFSLGMNVIGQLRLMYYYGREAPVGSVDELLTFLNLVRERVGRRKGQVARREKVRKLRRAAVSARIQELARTHRFDFALDENAVNVNISLRFDDLHIVEFTIPVAKFDELLPRLDTSIPLLRELVGSGIAANLRPRFASYTTGLKWVLHKSLVEDAEMDEE